MNVRRFGIMLAAFAIGLLLLTWWQNKNKPQTPPVNPTATAPASGPAAQPPQTALPSSAPTTGTATTGTATSGTATATPPAVTDRLWDDLQEAEHKVYLGSYSHDPSDNHYLFQLELTTQGAAVYTLKLTDFFATVDDKRLYDKDPAAYEQARLKDPAKYRGHFSVLNPVEHAGVVNLPVATRSVQLQFPGEAAPRTVRLDEFNWSAGPVKTEGDTQSVTFRCKVYRGPTQEAAQSNPVLEIAKTYTVRKGSYSVDVDLQMAKVGDGAAVQAGFVQDGPCGVPREDPRSDLRQAVYAAYLPSASKVEAIRKSVNEVQSWKPGQMVALGETEMLWVAVVDKFFGSAFYLKPAKDEPGKVDAPEYKAKFLLASAQESAITKTFTTQVEVPAEDLKKGEPRTVSFDLFAGPKKRDMFVDDKAPHFRKLYQQLDYIALIDLSGCCTWGGLTLGMMWLLQKFALIAFGNYGVAIIILVLLVRLLLHPITKKSQTSMMKMQKLGPEMQKLKEKYADDKDTLNREMMKFYKQQGATPILGCLPMLLQMPIWVALWTGLNAAVELRHAAFLPFWITDLAAPDNVISFGSAVTVPIISGIVGPITGLHLLPILLTIAMYFQTKLTPQMGQMPTTDQAKQQQKMMKVMMPAMMLLFFYSAPSGLTLYIMASTFAGVIEQQVIRKHAMKKEAEAAAMEVQVVAPGKAARGSRGKKPKGPMWFKR